MSDLILGNLQKYKFKKGNLTNEFISSLKTNDLFSFHCRAFVKLLGFKRCDKHFRAKFDDWLKEHSIKYVISNQPLTEFMIDNFLNAEKNVERELDTRCNRNNPNAPTQREFYQWVAKETNQTYEEVLQKIIDNRRKICGTLEIKEDKQKLNGSFQGGCWLILLKL